MTEKLDYKKLAKALADEMKDFQALTLSKKALAEFLGYSPYSSSVYRLMSEPDFPQPMPLMDGGEPRWLREDVVAYVKNKFDRSRELLAVGRR